MSKKKPRKKKNTPLKALANQVQVTKTATGGDQIKIEAEITLDPGWYTTTVELYSREGTDPPVWLSSMYYENTNSSGNEVYGAFVYESPGGPSPTYIVEADLMTYQTERVTGSV